MHLPASLSPLSRSLRKLRRDFMLWSFERLYHEFAWCYDLVAAVVSGGYWSRWINACVPFLMGDRVLEVGCGTGYLQRELERQGIPHVGLDSIGADAPCCAPQIGSDQTRNSGTLALAACAICLLLRRGGDLSRSVSAGSGNAHRNPACDASRW